MKASFLSKLSKTLPVLLFSAILSPASVAQDISGTINSSINLTPACQVNGSSALENVNFGNLNFGSRNTFFTAADAAVDVNGDSGININCSSGTTVNLSIEGGLNDGQVTNYTRAMVNGTSYVPYEIYASDERETPLLNNVNIPVVGTGSNVPISIYGRAFGGNGLPAGSYTDTLTVKITF